MERNYLIIAIIVLFIGRLIYKSISYKKVIAKYKEQNPQIIDVRSQQEYISGHYPDSINIPLDQLSNRLNSLDKTKTTLVVCLSGTRSGMAVNILKKNGFIEVYNAGPWTNL